MIDGCILSIHEQNAKAPACSTNSASVTNGAPSPAILHFYRYAYQTTSVEPAKLIVNATNVVSLLREINDYR